ncbi:MAG: WG repeat-containing protein [Alistipes sp.]|nr:WG repeat-containing protein [Alistipes sp.]
MSNNTNAQMKPSMDVIARIDELEAMIKSNDPNMTEALYEEHANLINNYDWYDEEVEENGKVGLKNVKGEVLVPAIYDGIASFESYFFPSFPIAAEKDGKQLLVKRDGKGTPVTEALYTHIQRITYSAIYAVCQEEGGKYCALMAGGEVFTPYEIERCYPMVDGCIIVEANGKYGVLSVDQGLVYISPEYDEVCDQGFGDDFLFVKDGVEGYVTLDNRFISKEEYEKLEPEAQDELFEVGFVGSVDDF